MRQPNGQSSMNNYLLRSGKSVKIAWPTKLAPTSKEEGNSWEGVTELATDIEGATNLHSSFIERPILTGQDADKQQQRHKRRSNSCPSLDLLQIQIQPSRGQIQDVQQAQQVQQAPSPDPTEYLKRNATVLRAPAGGHLDPSELQLGNSKEKTNMDVIKNQEIAGKVLVIEAQIHATPSGLQAPRILQVPKRVTTAHHKPCPDEDGKDLVSSPGKASE